MVLSLQFAIIALSVAGFLSGTCTSALARSQHPRISQWGRCLSFGILVGLGLVGVCAACYCIRSLAVVGILAGLLVVAMVWDAPAPRFEANGRV